MPIVSEWSQKIKVLTETGIGECDLIAPGNQVWFASEAAAQNAGYTAAKNCKGLAG
jgi:hypothetical protein